MATINVGGRIVEVPGSARRASSSTPSLPSRNLLNMGVAQRPSFIFGHSMWAHSCSIQYWCSVPGEADTFTRQGSQVQTLHHPPNKPLARPACKGFFVS